MINQEGIDLVFRHLDLSWDERLNELNSDELRARWIAAWEEAASKEEVFTHMPKPANAFMAMPPMTLLWFTVVEFESAIDAVDHKLFAVPQHRDGGPKYWIR